MVKPCYIIVTVVPDVRGTAKNTLGTTGRVCYSLSIKRDIYCKSCTLVICMYLANLVC